MRASIWTARPAGGRMPAMLNRKQPQRTAAKPEPPPATRSSEPGSLPGTPSGRAYTYTAFGQQYGETSAETLPQRYTFTGREAAGPAARAAGAPMYYRYRMYSPPLGRFGRRDPVLGGDPLYNAYVFPGSDHINEDDPMGIGGPKRRKPLFNPLKEKPPVTRPISDMQAIVGVDPPTGEYDQPTIDAVKRLQEDMARNGTYKGKIDGKWGNGTETAYRHNPLMHSPTEHARHLRQSATPEMSTRGAGDGSGRSPAFLATFVAALPRTLGKFRPLSLRFPIGVIGPFGTVEGELGAEGEMVKCSIPGTRDVGLMFSGRVWGAVDVGIGNIIGDKGDMRTGRFKSGPRQGQQYFKQSSTGRFAKSPYGNTVTGGIAGGELPCCEDKLDLVLRLKAYAVAQLVLRATAEVEVGQCSITGGCKWTWEPRYSVDLGYSGAGARMALEASASVEGSAVIHKNVCSQ